jgi:hypothetical protein
LYQFSIFDRTDGRDLPVNCLSFSLFNPAGTLPEKTRKYSPATFGVAEPPGIGYTGSRQSQALWNMPMPPIENMQRERKGFEMDLDTDGENLLWELAETMTSQDNYSVGVALRKLVQAGYSTLEQVDATSDWVLLATPGIGIGRLAAVRRLVRPDWQRPTADALKAAESFLSAARFALRFWPVEALEPLVEGSAPQSTDDRPVEKRLAMELFSQATRKAMRYCGVEELLQALQQTSIALQESA